MCVRAIADSAVMPPESYAGFGRYQRLPVRPVVPCARLVQTADCSIVLVTNAVTASTQGHQLHCPLLQWVLSGLSLGFLSRLSWAARPAGLMPCWSMVFPAPGSGVQTCIAGGIIAPMAKDGSMTHHPQSLHPSSRRQGHHHPIMAGGQGEGLFRNVWGPQNIRSKKNNAGE